MHTAAYIDGLNTKLNEQPGVSAVAETRDFSWTISLPRSCAVLFMADVRQ